MTSNWIWEENLEAFVQVAARLSGYANFNTDDWVAIRSGVADTDVEHEKWYEYPFDGEQPLVLKIARDIGTAVLFVRFEREAAMKDRLELLIDVCQDFRVFTRN